MNRKIEDAINDQIQEELFSAYLYLSMAAYCAHKGLTGFENWFTIQAKEEYDHAMGFYRHQAERGGRVVLKQLAQPQSEFSGPTHLFEAALQHEQHITEKINELYELAMGEKDFAFQSFLKWYIDEQVEEEDNARTMLDKLRLVGDRGHQLYMLDKELAERMYTPSGPAVES